MVYPYRKIIKPPLGSRPYKGHRLTRGLVGYWLMNERSGTKAFDLSGNGNTGTLVADAHFVPGKFGPALDFDGTGDKIDCGTGAILDVAGPFTLSVWIKYTSSTTDMGIIANFFSYDKGYMIASSSTPGRIVFSCYGSGYNDLFYIPTLNDGIWHHIVGVDTGVGHIIYIDGIYGNSDSNVFPKGIPTGEPFEIGDRQDTGVPFNGQIDNVMIYNRALSASEIALLYREPFCMFQRPGELAIMGGYEAPVGNNVPVKMRTYRNFRVA